MPAMFDLGPNGLEITVDPDDNQAGHPLPNSESGLVAVFDVMNVGDEEGQCRAGIEIDDTFLVEWPSEPVAPGGQVHAVQRLGKQPAGEYTFLIYVNPGSGQNDHTTTGITVA